MVAGWIASVEWGYQRKGRGSGAAQYSLQSWLVLLAKEDEWKLVCGGWIDYVHLKSELIEERKRVRS